MTTMKRARTAMFAPAVALLASGAEVTAVSEAAALDTRARLPDLGRSLAMGALPHLSKCESAFSPV